MVNHVSFPGLGISFPLSRSFSLFGLNFYFYGIIIAAAIIVATIYTARAAKKYGMSEDVVYDVVLWGIPSAIVFARLYYVVFSFDEYWDNLWDIFKIWEGGIAIYGAIIGALLSTFIYCRVKKIPFLKVIDLCSVGLLIGQCIGRWANFINQEAFGGNTTLPWGMTSENVVRYLEQLQAGGYPVDPALPVHPTFLYESLWNFIGIFLLIWYRKHTKFNGELFLSYVFWYGLGRMFIEGLRTDSLMLGPLRVSQVLAGVSAAVAIVFIIIFRRRAQKRVSLEPADAEKNDTAQEKI